MNRSETLTSLFKVSILEYLSKLWRLDFADPINRRLNVLLPVSGTSLGLCKR